MVHALKIKPEYFDAISSGKKTFEVRALDRPYEVGDFLALNECNESGYTGRCMMVSVSYVLTDFELIKSGAAVISIIPCRVAWRDYDFEHDRYPHSVPVYDRGENGVKEVGRR